MFVPPQPAQAGLAAAMQPAPELPPGQSLPGKVKAWMEDKGFGFITPDNGGPDVFVHRNQLSDGQMLVAGAAVVFECRLNVARGKYEATTCSGAAGSPSAVPAPFDISTAKGLAAGKGGMKGSQDNLFVAGLPLETTEEQIRELFGQYGIVQQCKVLPDTPGKTDRAALVRFADEQQAKWMVENLNGRALPGMVSPLTVRFAGDRPEKGGCFYGKALGKGEAILDNRFAPYAAVTAAAQVGAPANPQLSDATLAAALMQLLPGLNQNAQPLQGLQGAQGLQSVAALQVGMASPETTVAVSPLAGQAVGVQQLGAQALGGQQLLAVQPPGAAGAQQLGQVQVLGGQALGQILAAPGLLGQTAPVQAFAGQVGGAAVAGQALPGQAAPGQALGGQALQPLGGQQLGAAPLVGAPLAALDAAPAGGQAQAAGPPAAAAPAGPGAGAAGACAATAPAAAALTAPAALAAPAAGLLPVQASQLPAAEFGGTQPSSGNAGAPGTAPAVAAAPGGAAAPAAAPTPGGQWLEATDPASGRPYYYHSATREVRWDRPAEPGA